MRKFNVAFEVTEISLPSVTALLIKEGEISNWRVSEIIPANIAVPLKAEKKSRYNAHDVHKWTTSQILIYHMKMADERTLTVKEAGSFLAQHHYAATGASPTMTRLKQAGYVVSVREGTYMLTQKGVDLPAALPASRERLPVKSF